MSLTTFPERFPTLGLVLRSLLSQTVVPAKIYVHVAVDEIRSRVDEKAVQNFGQLERVEVRIVEPNFRSYNKLVHLLSSEPQARIITVDDDLYYHPKLIEALVRVSDRFPGWIACGRGMCMLPRSQDEFIPFLFWPKATKVAGSGIFLQGAAGVLYPPGCLHEDALNPELFQTFAPGNDDVWFHTMAVLKGTAVYSAGIEWKKHKPIEIRKNRSLAAENHSGRQDLCHRRVLEHYGLKPQHIISRTYFAAE